MRKYNINAFKEKAKKVHGNKYDYSKVEYVNSQTKVCIICPEHGEFWQTPANHLNGQRCPKCSIKKVHEKQKFNTEKFIEQAKKVHGNKYDYSKVEYINNKTKVCIICPEHGEFWQRPDKHIHCSRGCPKCGGTDKLTTEEFIKKAKEVHGNKYDYSKVEYRTTERKVCIVCPEHGEFLQTPHAHLYGQGCPYCLTFLLENEVASFLDFNGIRYERRKHFKWLGKKSLDFYLPDYNIAIECQGIQHFEPVWFFGGEKTFKKQIKRDILKKEQCDKNGIKLLYYTKKNNNFITNTSDLLIEIKNGNKQQNN